MKGNRPLALLMSVALVASMTVLPASADEAPPQPDRGGVLTESVDTSTEDSQTPPADQSTQPSQQDSGSDPAPKQDPDTDPATGAAPSALGASNDSSNPPSDRPAKGDEFVEGIYKYLITAIPTAEGPGKVTVVKNGYMGVHTIPGTVTHKGAEFTVTEIGKAAFSSVRNPQAMPVVR